MTSKVVVSIFTPVWFAGYPPRVLGYSVNGAADEVALAMLAHLIDDLPIAMEITAARI